MKKLFCSNRDIGFAIVVISLCAPSTCHAGGLVANWGWNLNGQCSPPNGLNNIKAIAGGVDHSLALRADGTVIAWGANNNLQRDIPLSLSGVVAISAGVAHNLALRSDSTVVAWGSNHYGESSVPTGLSNIVAIAAGGGHNLALKADGTVISWGINAFGLTNVPAGLSNVITIAVGWHNLALRAGGTVVAWGGENTYGEINVPAGLSNVVAIAAGSAGHSIALKADGTVVAWGFDTYGQATVPAGLSNVIAISAGAVHSLALKADGSVVAWGANFYGATNVPPGMSNVTAIAAGGYHNLVLGSEGPPVIVQQPESQSISYTSNATFSVVTTGREPLGYRWFRDGQPLTDSVRVFGVTNSTLSISNAQFSDIGTYTVVVSNAFGSVISDGATLTVFSPPFITAQSANRPVGAGADVTLSVSTGGTTPLSYQWLLNGTNLPGKTSSSLNFINIQPAASGVYSLLVTNLYGSAQADIVLTVTNSSPYFLQQPFVRLPDQSTTINPIVPIGGSVTFNVSARGSLPLSYQWRFNGEDIPGATNATLPLVNMRMDQTGYYSIVVRNAFGEVVSAKVFLNVVQVYVWGADIQIVGGVPANVPVGLTNAVAVAAGNYHILALKADGRVATWGIYPYAAFSLTNVPASATNVTAIAAASDINMALRANGSVIVWGNNFYGQTNVPASVSNITAIAAGGSHCLALRTNGTIVGWGNNSYGQATSPAGLSNIIAIAAGGAHSLALKPDGTVVGWGYNFYGQTNPPAGLSNVIAIDAAGAISLALKADGTAVSWGDPYGRVPTNLTNLVATAAGYQRNVAIKSDGTIVSWVGNQTPPSPVLSNVIAVAAGERGSFAAAVIGNGSPFFTIHPASQSTVKSNTVKLHARAVGVQPMRYHWQFENQNLPGATNATLIITNAQGQHAGSYQMIASNALGSTLSRTVMLTIPYNTDLAAALNAANLAWDTFSSTSKTAGLWFAQIRETHDGDAAAQSGRVGDNQQSILQTTVTGPGTLTFWWKVSSEQGYDFLRFFTDNLTTPLTSISGETEWQQRTFAIGSGTHTLRWAYAKDVSVSSGRDAGWLDEVIFTPGPPVIIRHPFDQTVPAGVNVTIPAVAGSPTTMSYQWLKNGTNLQGANAQYLTLTNVTRSDSATYALKVSNAGGGVISSNATLKVNVPQRLGMAGWSPDGCFALSSCDADGGWLLPSDLAGLEAQASTDLTDWVALPGVLTLTNGSLLLRDPDAASMPRRFYRIVKH